MGRISKKMRRALAFVLAAASSSTLVGCNISFLDTQYGLGTALIIGDDTATELSIQKWKDYEGEQYQISTADGLVMLTSSFDTDLFFSDYPADIVAANSVSENGEVYDMADSNTPLFNYDLLDTNWRYNKATLFNKNKALILNLAKWKDYEGEQLQVATDTNMTLLLSSYYSKLFYDLQSSIKAEEFARKYVGSDGKVSEIGNDIDPGLFNYDIIDLQYSFNKIIIFKDDTAVILPVDAWKDYEGEQLQVKITGGPTIVTASYDSILVNDVNSSSDAFEVASAIADHVIDYTKGIKYDKGFYNKTILDLEYGFNNCIISNDNSATSIPVSSWRDYEGEQLQIKLANGDIILTSSVFLDLINGGSSSINASSLANDYSTGKVIDKATNVTDRTGFNKQIIDLDYHYNYAIHVENGNVTILPLSRWKDYYNSDGIKSSDRSRNPDGTYHATSSDDEDSPNCEQFQLELPDGTVLVTSAYDTALVKSSDVMAIAEMFRGDNGVITDLTPVFGQPSNNFLNWSLFDTHWTFNYAIYNNGENSQIFPVYRWKDYSDGEQVQLKFSDGSGFLTAYTNTTLVYSNNYDKVKTIARAFAGAEKEKVKSYVNH